MDILKLAREVGLYANSYPTPDRLQRFADLVLEAGAARLEAMPKMDAGALEMRDIGYDEGVAASIAIIRAMKGAGNG